MKNALDTRHITIPVDEETHSRLVNLADMCHADFRTVAASLLHDLLQEDAEAHALEMMPAAGRA